MSKLQELINECCPDGVEYINIKELINQHEVITITPSFKVKRNDYLQKGKVPIVSQEEEYISGYYEQIDKNIPKDEYVCFGDHSEHIKYVDFSFVQGADGLKIIKTSEHIITKYLYYAVSSFYKKHNNYERHFKYFCETEIPLPPLAVQREIVRILDSFTLYSQELAAELAARKKQYEYYRDQLLTFKEKENALL